MNDSYADVFEKNDFTYPYTRGAKIISSNEKKESSNQILIDTLEKSIQKDFDNRKYNFKDGVLDPYLYGGVYQTKPSDLLLPEKYDDLDAYLTRKIQSLKVQEKNLSPPIVRKKPLDDPELKSKLLDALNNEQPMLTKEPDKVLPPVEIKKKPKSSITAPPPVPPLNDDERPIKPMKGDFLSQLNSIPNNESNPSTAVKEKPKYITKSELARAVSKPNSKPPTKQEKKPEEPVLSPKPVSPIKSKNNPPKRHLDLNSAYDPQNIPLIANQTRNRLTPRNPVSSSAAQQAIPTIPQQFQYPVSAPIANYPLVFPQNQLYQQPQIIYVTDPGIEQIQPQQQYYMMGQDYQQPLIYPQQQPQVIYIQEEPKVAVQQPIVIPESTVRMQEPKEVFYEVVKRKSPIKTVYRHIYE